jgi:hypothetical protein
MDVGFVELGPLAKEASRKVLGNGDVGRVDGEEAER